MKDVLGPLVLLLAVLFVGGTFIFVAMFGGQLSDEYRDWKQIAREQKLAQTQTADSPQAASVQRELEHMRRQVEMIQLQLQLASYEKEVAKETTWDELNATKERNLYRVSDGDPLERQPGPGVSAAMMIYNVDADHPLLDYLETKNELKSRRAYNEWHAKYEAAGRQIGGIDIGGAIPGRGPAGVPAQLGPRPKWEGQRGIRPNDATQTILEEIERQRINRR